MAVTNVQDGQTDLGGQVYKLTTSKIASNGNEIVQKDGTTVILTGDIHIGADGRLVSGNQSTYRMENSVFILAQASTRGRNGGISYNTADNRGVSVNGRVYVSNSFFIIEENASSDQFVTTFENSVFFSHQATGSHLLRFQDKGKFLNSQVHIKGTGSIELHGEVEIKNNILIKLDQGFINYSTGKLLDLFEQNFLTRPSRLAFVNNGGLRYVNLKFANAPASEQDIKAIPVRTTSNTETRSVIFAKHHKIDFVDVNNKTLRASVWYYQGSNLLYTKANSDTYEYTFDLIRTNFSGQSQPNASPGTYPFISNITTPVRRIIALYGYQREISTYVSYDFYPMFDGKIILLEDTNITEKDVNVVKAYTNLKTKEQLFDYHQYWLSVNPTKEPVLDVDHDHNEVHFEGGHNVVVDKNAAQVFTADDTTVTIKSDEIVLDFETTGTVTTKNGAKISGNITDSSGDSTVTFPGMIRWLIYRSQTDADNNQNVIAQGTTGAWRFQISTYPVGTILWAKVTNPLRNTVTLPITIKNKGLNSYSLSQEVVRSQAIELFKRIALKLQQIQDSQRLTHAVIVTQNVKSHIKFDLNEAEKSRFTVVTGSRTGDLLSFTGDNLIIDIPVDFDYIDAYKIDKITLPQGDFEDWYIAVYGYKGSSRQQFEGGTNGSGYLNRYSFGSFDSFGSNIPQNWRQGLTKIRIEMSAKSASSARLKIEGFELFTHHTQDITKGRPPYAQLADDDKNMLRETLANAKNGANAISRTIPFNKD